MASSRLRTGVEAFHTAPTETSRAVEPTQLNFGGSNFACAMPSSGPIMKPRVMKPQ